MPTVMSLSYGECEPAGFVDGTVAAVNFLWMTAAQEGVTVFVASGDAGSTVCDQGAPAALQGLAVSGMSATNYNVAVGGTDFHDLHQTSQYWTSGNLPLGKSAIGYIPEMTWNDSCASSVVYPLLGFSNGVDACNSIVGQSFLGTVGGSGGPSQGWSQETWQQGLYGTSNHGFRLQPDVSLFAANGLFGHALVFCMSDVNSGGTPCDYSDPDSVYFNSAGGTSFAAPAMAGVQALINQAVGAHSGYIFPGNGNMLPALYAAGTKEYGTNGSPNTAMLTACNSSNGAAIGQSCVFNDVTVGDIDQPCYAGSSDCYSGTALTKYGVASAGGAVTLAPAWMTNAGYDEATGLGTINAANLVNAMVKYYRPFQRGYVAPEDFLSTNGFTGDGFSDIALVDPVQGTFKTLGMKGSVINQSASQAIAPGYSIGAIGDFLGGREIDELGWTGPDNRLYMWQGDGEGHFVASAIGSVYPAGWKLMGSATPDSTRSTELFWFNAATAQFGWWKVAFSWTTFGYVPTMGPLTTVAPGYVPTLADVNGDGYVDIVWTSTTDNSVYVWINDQQGNYVRQRITDHPSGFTLFGAGDISGDGTTALVWTNASTNQISCWLMDGFNVTAQKTSTTAAGYTLASIADYDGDGLADLLWVGTAGDVYEWQSSGGGFQSFRVADATGKPLTVPAGTQIQANRLQGLANGGINTSIGSSH
jgi:FG-GAP-like repeat/Subtilase family